MKEVKEVKDVEDVEEIEERRGHSASAGTWVAGIVGCQVSIADERNRLCGSRF